MTFGRLIFTSLVVCLFVLSVEMLSTSGASAQDSHFSNLAKMYKEQNPQAGKRPPRSRRSPLNNPSGMNPYAPPAESGLNDPEHQGVEVTVHHNVAPVTGNAPTVPGAGPYAAAPYLAGHQGIAPQARLDTVPGPPPGLHLPGPVAGGGLIPDPYARPDDLINRENNAMPDNRIRIPQGLQSDSSSPNFGNPRDPLKPVDGSPPLLSREDVATPYSEMVLDARLNDVCFTDSSLGWAVGDRGAIWHTQDGGTNWTLQETPVSCTLYGVSFLDANYGMAVGGYRLPFTDRSCGVILATHDGGKTWSRIQTDPFPVLTHVQIVDPMKCFLAGESSERYPGGLFLSRDAGKTWFPLSEEQGEGWRAVELLEEKVGFGIGVQGSAQVIRDRISLSQTPLLDKVRLRDVKIVPSTSPSTGAGAWMVGEGGLILSSSDLGLRWSIVPGTLPGRTATQVDLETIEARGDHLWVAGSPGTFIYRSTDLGKTWKAVSTGLSATIRKIAFTDDRNGWAVGDLGTILKTADGGETWVVQRAGGKRLAVLGIYGCAEEIPLEAFVQLCAHQGYFGGALLLFRDPVGPLSRDRSAREERVREAMLRVGACGLWESGPFPLPRTEGPSTFERLVERLQKESDGKALEQIRERLVAAIRQWKPDVILTAEVGDSKDPVRLLVLREVMEAVRMAADPKAFPYQLTELNLTPWEVTKVHCHRNSGEPGDVNLMTTQPSIRLGQAPDEIAFPAYGLISPNRSQAGTPILGFSTVYDRSSSPGRDLFAGIEIAPGSEARRALVGHYAEHWEEIQRRTQQWRHVQGIIRNMGNTARENGQALSDIRLASSALELTRKIDPEVALMMLLDMGRRFSTEGDWESAREAYDIIARHYPSHPLSKTAFSWLLQYYASEEIGWRKHRSNTAVEGHVQYDKKGGTASWNARKPVGDRHQLDPRLDQAMMIGNYLQQNDPEQATDPALRFALASAMRRQGLGYEALKIYRQRGALKYEDVWGMRARAEMWLAVEDKTELPAEQQESPLPSIFCCYTPRKPRLDGQFDKEFDQGTWFNAKLHALTPEKPRRRLGEMLKTIKPGSGREIGIRREEALLAESKNFGTQVMFMYDNDFLFVGVKGKRVEGFSYPPVPEKPRYRDLPVDDQDRVEILLDVDRDYGTYYTVTIDSRGWTVDSCWGDKGWNPERFVARHEDRDHWYIEAAIPMDSLTDRPPIPRNVWGVGIRRIVPGVGIECWNAENSFDLVEGLGFLVFE